MERKDNGRYHANGKDRAMSTDHRHLISRPSVRATVLASALGAVLGMSAESAGAASFHGSSFSSTRTSGATNRPNQTDRMQRTTKPKWTPSQHLGSKIVVVRPPSGEGGT